MKWLVVLVRSLLTVALATALVAAAAYLGGEATVAWYMQHYAVTARADLSNDMGFGMLGFVVVCISTLVSSPLALFAGWRLSGRLASSVMANPLFQRTASGGR
jgi:hypothetical protein